MFEANRRERKCSSVAFSIPEGAMGLKHVHCEAVLELTPEAPTDEGSQMKNSFDSNIRECFHHRIQQ